MRDRSILSLYNKLRELVSLTAELLNIQVLTDTTVLQVSSLGVAPFFVENISELQLSALKLVTTVSSEKGRTAGKCGRGGLRSGGKCSAAGCDAIIYCGNNHYR